MEIKNFISFLEDFLRSFCDDESIKLDENTTLSELPGWSSMALVSSLTTIQSNFNVVADLDKVYSAITVGDLYKAFQ
ncbi:Uncharacterised protein [Anaerobiospirillum thomasii]|uniref:hypothetical protein n=1 Tax=Anaerobiospirillum thomasii TaxID=179995 RepID=UPI000D9F4D47|nr:hypothetical protein [Anaerobiospirillum thomasii]SPT68347.1 Uncharacterised protein [Anaerobiospirillum thomasii]